MNAPFTPDGAARALDVSQDDVLTLTAGRLRELLSYDPLLGELRWKVATSNRVRVGGIAGGLRPDGYRRIRIDGVRYLAHRLIFLYALGKFPELDVDHIDGDRSNNRWSNLREATASQNSANSRCSRRNRTGLKGVRWHERADKWYAQIRANGQTIHLGSFDTPEAAHKAYVVAAIKHHGEFANDGTGSILNFPDIHDYTSQLVNAGILPDLEDCA